METLALNLALSLVNDPDDDGSNVPDPSFVDFSGTIITRPHAKRLLNRGQLGFPYLIATHIRQKYPKKSDRFYCQYQKKILEKIRPQFELLQHKISFTDDVHPCEFKQRQCSLMVQGAYIEKVDDLLARRWLRRQAASVQPPETEGIDGQPRESERQRARKAAGNTSAAPAAQSSSTGSAVAAAPFTEPSADAGTLVIAPPSNMLPSPANIASSVDALISYLSYAESAPVDESSDAASVLPATPSGTHGKKRGLAEAFVLAPETPNFMTFHMEPRTPRRQGISSNPITPNGSHISYPSPALNCAPARSASKRARIAAIAGSSSATAAHAEILGIEASPSLIALTVDDILDYPEIEGGRVEGSWRQAQVEHSDSNYVRMDGTFKHLSKASVAAHQPPTTPAPTAISRGTARTAGMPNRWVPMASRRCRAAGATLVSTCTSSSTAPHRRATHLPSWISTQM